MRTESSSHGRDGGRGPPGQRCRGSSCTRPQRGLRGGAPPLRPQTQRGRGRDNRVTLRVPVNVVIGVDGGNTKTDLAVATLDGEPLVYLRGPGSNSHGLGSDGAVAVIATLVERATFERPAEQGAFFLCGADVQQDIAELSAEIDARAWVRRATVDGDAVAHSLVGRLAEEIALMVRRAIADLGVSEVDVVLGGGMLAPGEGLLHDLVVARLPEGAQPVVPALPPVAGAVLAALDATGAPPSAHARLSASFRAGLRPQDVRG